VRGERILTVLGDSAELRYTGVTDPMQDDIEDGGAIRLNESRQIGGADVVSAR
jgi:hypothetical protein